MTERKDGVPAWDAILVAGHLDGISTRDAVFLCSCPVVQQAIHRHFEADASAVAGAGPG